MMEQKGYEYDKEAYRPNREKISYSDVDISDLRIHLCAICNYGITDEHHILPQANNKIPEVFLEINKVYLCPNHHRAIHVLMRFSIPQYYKKHAVDGDKNYAELIYLNDIDVLCLEFFENKIKPIWIKNFKKIHGHDPITK